MLFNLIARLVEYSQFQKKEVSLFLIKAIIKNIRFVKRANILCKVSWAMSNWV